MQPIADDRLRLIFTCCHPALAHGRTGRADPANARRADDARDRPRLPRARSRPSPSAWSAPSARSATPASPTASRRAELLPERLDGVLARGLPGLQRGLRGDRPATRSIRARAVRRGDPAGTDRGVAAPRRAGGGRAARPDAAPRRAARGARRTGAASSILLDDQDRARWDAGADRRGPGAGRARRCACGAAGPYQVQAAIAALHDEAATPAETDWPQIVALYRTLQRMAPSPVVELNLAAAVAMADGPAVGLAMMDGIAASGELDDVPVPARRSGGPAAAARAAVRGGGRVSPRAGPDDERAGARVPGTPACARLAGLAAAGQRGPVDASHPAWPLAGRSRAQADPGSGRPGRVARRPLVRGSHARRGARSRSRTRNRSYDSSASNGHAGHRCRAGRRSSTRRARPRTLNSPGTSGSSIAWTA